MRITENMMTSTYNRNLQRNISDLASSNLKLSSKRQYNHVSEDPATASKAFAIRDQIARSEEHISVVKNARGELDTADSNIVTLNSILETVSLRIFMRRPPKQEGPAARIPWMPLRRSWAVLRRRFCRP